MNKIKGGGQEMAAMNNVNHDQFHFTLEGCTLAVLIDNNTTAIICFSMILFFEGKSVAMQVFKYLYIILVYIMLVYIMLVYIMLVYIMLVYIMLVYIMLVYIMLVYIMLVYIMLVYIMLVYIMLVYVFYMQLMILKNNHSLMF